MVGSFSAVWCGCVWKITTPSKISLLLLFLKFRFAIFNLRSEIVENVEADVEVENWILSLPLQILRSGTWGMWYHQWGLGERGSCEVIEVCQFKYEHISDARWRDLNHGAVKNSWTAWNVVPTGQVTHVRFSALIILRSMTDCLVSGPEIFGSVCNTHKGLTYVRTVWGLCSILDSTKL